MQARPVGGGGGGGGGVVLAGGGGGNTTINDFVYLFNLFLFRLLPAALYFWTPTHSLYRSAESSTSSSLWRTSRSSPSTTILSGKFTLTKVGRCWVY